MAGAEQGGRRFRPAIGTWVSADGVEPVRVTAGDTVLYEEWASEAAV